jgi:hypothetical protein
MSAMLLYQGRDFISVGDKMVSFKRLNNKWHLSYLAATPLNDESLIFEGIISKYLLSATSDLNIYQKNKGEIILFDNNKSKMYSLWLTIFKTIKSSSIKSNAMSAASNSYVLHIRLLTGLLLLLLLLFAYRKGIHRDSFDLLIDKDNLRFEYEPTTQTVMLFKANKT